MKKINRIKLIVAALPVSVILLLLFFNWYQSCQSYKSLSNWGKGLSRYSEQAYYNNKLRNIITKWQKAANNPNGSIKDSNSTFLHFDLEQNAVWLEENGQVKIEDYIDLPEQTTWALQYSSLLPTINLPKRVILRTLKVNQILTGQFFLSTETRYSSYCFVFDNKIFSGGPFPRGSIIQNLSPASNNPQVSIDYTSLIISEEEYKKYKDSLAKTNPEQSGEQANETPETKALEENKAGWLKAEKLLYMEIDGQILNAGYELNSLEVEAGSDYTGACAIMEARGENAIHRYLHLDGSKTVRAYLKIDYLGDNIWYAGTAPHPARKLETDSKLNLEFLIFPEEQISRSQYRKYIKQGRRLQQSESFPTAKWKAALPDGVVIEILGIRDSNNPDKWWGPDGSALEFPDYFKIESVKADENTSQIAWQIKFPENRGIRQTFFVPEGAKDTRSVAAHDRYGNTESVMISVYDSSLEKISFSIGTQASGQTSEYANFNNVSLVPGRNEGFNIEAGEK
jgi:hypothetical protein